MHPTDGCMAGLFSRYQTLGTDKVAPILVVCQTIFGERPFSSATLNNKFSGLSMEEAFPNNLFAVAVKFAKDTGDAGLTHDLTYVHINFMLAAHPTIKGRWVIYCISYVVLMSYVMYHAFYISHIFI